MGSLLVHEDRLKKFNKKPLEQAFQTKLKFSNGENKNGHGKNYEKGETSYNRGRRRGNFKNQGSRVNNQNGHYCKLCKKTNHNTNDCHYRCKKCKKHTYLEKDCWYQQKEEVNYSENNKSDEQIFYNGLNAQEKVNDVWYIDSGCSNHMSGR